ncbi:Snrna-activating protein complex subunit 3, partial [Globisporangium splendens]
MAMAGGHRHGGNALAFAALFPPLLTDSTAATDTDTHTEQGDDVDISVDDLLLPPLEKAVETALYSALQRWNELEPVKMESALGHTDRLKKYRTIVNRMLYGYDDNRLFNDDGGGNNEDGAQEEAEEVVDDSADASARRKRRIADANVRRQRKAQKRELAKREKQFEALAPIFQSMPSADALRAERTPSARLQEFVATYTAKKRTLSQKRSVGDTKTARCFEFARRPLSPSYFSHAKTRDNDEDEDEDDNGDEAAAKDGDTPVNHPPRMLRDQNLLLARDAAFAADTNSALSKPQTDEELVIWLDVLHPSKDPAKTQSFVVRSSQRLSDIVDLIVCAYDQRLGNHGKHSKLLYFDETFYVDRRHPDHVDHAESIRVWIRKSATRIAKYGDPNAASKALETTTFRDIALHVDMPGLYVHQGECEHLIRIRDARLPHEYDAKLESDLDAFPMRLPNPHHRALRNCFVCQQYSAKFICYGDRMGISDPMFFCDRCYRVAHFGADGNLIYKDFQAFPYIQD